LFSPCGTAGVCCTHDCSKHPISYYTSAKGFRKRYRIRLHGSRCPRPDEMGGDGDVIEHCAEHSATPHARPCCRPDRPASPPVGVKRQPAWGRSGRLLVASLCTETVAAVSRSGIVSCLGKQQQQERTWSSFILPLTKQQLQPIQTCFPNHQERYPPTRKPIHTLQISPFNRGA
jgi:hypothetical protein